MRRRLYFLFPSIADTRTAIDRLLLKRIPFKHMHVIGKEDADLADLPEASIIQKFDIMHSLIIGAVIGAIIGIIAGIVAHNQLGVPLGGGLIAALIVGLLLGAWSSSMIGLMIPNTHLKEFTEPIEKGQLLLMVDVPKEQVPDIEATVKKLSPNADYKGIEPTIPGFP